MELDFDRAREFAKHCWQVANALQYHASILRHQAGVGITGGPVLGMDAEQNELASRARDLLHTIAHSIGAHLPTPVLDAIGIARAKHGLPAEFRFHAESFTSAHAAAAYLGLVFYSFVRDGHPAGSAVEALSETEIPDLEFPIQQEWELVKATHTATATNTGGTELRGGEKTLIELLQSVGKRMTTNQILSELSRRNIILNEGTVKKSLADLVRMGELTNQTKKPRGYGLPTWGN